MPEKTTQKEHGTKRRCSSLSWRRRISIPKNLNIERRVKHILGVRFMLEHKGEMPKGFGRLCDWNEYYKNLVAEGEDERSALSISISNEPKYLTALRIYLNRKEVPDTNEYRRLAKKMENTAAHFTELMGDSAFRYIFSDWHYACVAETREKFIVTTKKCPAINNDKERLRRITRPVSNAVAAIIEYISCDCTAILLDCYWITIHAVILLSDHIATGI